MNPYSWSVVFVFCAIATLFSISYGWLVKKEKLPFNSNMDFNNAQWQFMNIWVKIALLLGIILPLFMWFFLWSETGLRQFFGCYLFAISIQLTSEISLSRIFCKSVVVIVGTLYTGFRIWQLWLGLGLLNTQPWFTLYLLILLFWIANMIMLMTLAIPNISTKLKKQI